MWHRRVIFEAIGESQRISRAPVQCFRHDFRNNTNQSAPSEAIPGWAPHRGIPKRQGRTGALDGLNWKKYWTHRTVLYAGFNTTECTSVGFPCKLQDVLCYMSKNWLHSYRLDWWWEPKTIVWPVSGKILCLDSRVLLASRSYESPPWSKAWREIWMRNNKWITLS